MPAFQATVPYANEGFADLYFAEQVGPGTTAWNLTANATKKTPALKMATNLIDTLHFIRRKAEAEQIREFPRSNDTDIPVEVAQACCEVAGALLRGKTLDAIAESDGVAAESVGDASVSFSDDGARELLNKSGQLPSPQAYRLLRPWLVKPERINLERV